MRYETASYTAEEILLARINKLKILLNEMYYINNEHFMSEELLILSCELDQLIFKYMVLNKSCNSKTKNKHLTIEG